ncbi:PAS domain-containing hybrid sensor histidine kinase/response regulator [Phenylobacterium kunshanense]|uniref:histidine kinase n=1 Tax=Phenylobacterium kunshanense TaxID=1445034 RepID=A0A328BE27_9CAUL|nr:PAS domain-containing hybrid sensor histidine kinase/response regulator [Phenylobacterium kunshanense]RAK65592.1 hypothetical protein DJ019_11580 [Phenylobacterium kunshanense]
MRPSETPALTTGKIEVEPELLERLKLQSAILDSAGYAIIATDPSGVITEFNRAAERMLGYAAEEMIGRYTPEVLHVEAEVIARATQFGAEVGLPVTPDFDTFVVKARLGLPNEHEWTYVRKDGCRLSVLLNITGLKGATGEITGYLGIASDITRRKQADDDLRASEEKLRKLFELSSLGIVLTTFDGRYVEFNDAFCQLTGYAREELLTLDYWTLTPEEYAADEEAQLASLERHGRYGPYYKDYVTKSGVRTPLRLNGMTLTGPDGQRYIWSIVEDISADLEARAELVEARAEAANLAKSEFLANMSHEIRTPLNGVAGVAGALARTPLTGPQREMVSIIESSARTLETLLSDILDLARVEAGKFELRPEPFDLASSVTACAALFDAAAQAKGLDLEVEITPEATGCYVGDAARLRQILSNLLGNALKFTTHGGVRLHVGAAASGRGLEFRVSDTGMGFDAEAKSRLFARFEQADGSITRRFGGSGLGLAISRALADAMGGALDAEAEPGRGATFTLTLDLPRSATPSPQRVEAEFEDDVSVGGLRVLLAEDHPTNRRVVELILGSAGVDLACVENGAEAVEAFAGGGFDMVLMDVQMPVMDGLTAVREIRAREAAAGALRTPIFVLTANAMPEHVSASRAAGADGHISKPINADELLRVVASAAAGARQSGSAV